MIFVRIDSEETKNVMGFELGNRAQFDEQRAGDPLWVFVDYKEATLRIRLNEFLVNPTMFRIVGNSFLSKKRIS